MVVRELLSKVRRIEIRTRQAVDELFAGAYHSVFRGRGIEFDEVREYVPGDDVRAIDWHVTARLNAPYVKQFVEERELNVALLVDLSGSGDFGSVGRSKNELAAELAGLLAFSAIRNGDRVSLLLFTDREELHLPPRKGRRQALRLIRELLAAERTSRGTNIRHALDTHLRAAKRRGIVFLISDFLDTGFEPSLRLAGLRHDVIAVRLLDPREAELPPLSWATFEDAETGEIRATGPWGKGRRRAFAAARQALHEESRRTIRRAGVDLIDLRTDQDYLPPLIQFFRRRARHPHRG